MDMVRTAWAEANDEEDYPEVSERRRALADGAFAAGVPVERDDLAGRFLQESGSGDPTDGCDDAPALGGSTFMDEMGAWGGALGL